MSMTTSHADDGRAGSLAKAEILQSIEDLWNPFCREGSPMFFKEGGFANCSEIAGIRYFKQLAMLRILADAGNKHGLIPGPYCHHEAFTAAIP